MDELNSLTDAERQKFRDVLSCVFPWIEGPHQDDPDTLGCLVNLFHDLSRTPKELVINANGSVACPYCGHGSIEEKAQGYVASEVFGVHEGQLYIYEGCETTPTTEEFVCTSCGREAALPQNLPTEHIETWQWENLAGKANIVSVKDPVT